LISLVLFLSTACLSFPLTGSEPGAAAPHALAARQSNDSEARLSGGHGSRGAAKRVAVIGAGASGTSAAWFLDRAAGEAATRIGLNKSQVLSEVVVFDQNDYVGGRTCSAVPGSRTLAS
jgi:prenylcysteine oxidase/farnesylcysteine lyase